MMPQFGSDMVNMVMQSQELWDFLKSDDKFDICIMELFGDEALLVSKTVAFNYHRNSSDYHTGNSGEI